LKKIEEMLKNKDIIRISESAASSFRSSLSDEEIKNCIYNAIWKANNRFDDSKNTKFTSYLHRGVVLECLDQQKANKGKIKTKSFHYQDSYNTSSVSCVFNRFNEIDMMDEIERCEDPKLLYDRFYLNMTIGELAKSRNVCGETIRTRLEKNLKKIKISLSGVVDGV